MATKNITGLHNGSIVVATSGNTYNIAENAKVIATADAPMSSLPNGAITEDQSAMPAPKNNTFNIDGRVIGSDAGVVLTGIGDEVHVGDTGKVSGSIGVALVGSNSILTNDGEIDGTMAGMYATLGTNIHMTNNGDVVGVIGIVAAEVNKALVVNGSHGSIIAIEYAVQLSSADGSTAKFVNHGFALASAFEGAAVSGGSGDDTIINDGTLTGNILLDNGDDTLDNRGGTIHGSIAGGGGDDVLITDKASDKLVEEMSGGTDTVRSTVTYKLSDNVENLFLLGNADINGTGTTLADKLHGNNGDNKLVGLQGDDELWGGKGTDQLVGGLGADTFHFVKGDGHDTIAIFEQGSDLIDVSQWTGLNAFTDVLNHAQDQGNDVKITVGSDSLVIGNVHKADLTDADFIFPT
jgi:serralysin